MRAFARDIEVNPGRISQYFDDHRAITKTVANKISAKLNLDESQKNYFLHLIATDERERRGDHLRMIEADELSMIVEWYHDALIALISTTGFKNDFDWMSERLGVPVPLIKASWDRLVRVGFITEVNDKVVLEPTPMTTSSGIPNEFLRLSHKDSLMNIIDNLDRVHVDKRDMSMITLAIDSKKIPKAKEMIKVFRRKLANYLAQGKKDRVYTINIQLFPLTKD